MDTSIETMWLTFTDWI